MQRNAWSGWISFAGWLMVIIRSIDAVEGLIAVIRGKYYVVSPQQIIVFDLKTWGWITLVWGILVALVGRPALGVELGALDGDRCRQSQLRRAAGLHRQHALRVVGVVRPGTDGRGAPTPCRALGRGHRDRLIQLSRITYVVNGRNAGRPG